MLKLSAKQLDALKEVATIGAAHSAMALSQMVGRRINMAVTRVEMVSSHKFEKFMGEKPMLAGISLKMMGEMQGDLVLLFQKSDAIKLANILLAQYNDQPSETISELEISILKEVGNVMSGSYLSSLSLMVHLKLALSIPRFVFDDFDKVISSILPEFIVSEKKVHALITEFIESSHQIKGYYIFLPARKILKEILNRLKVEP